MLEFCWKLLDFCWNLLEFVGMLLDFVGISLDGFCWTLLELTARFDTRMGHPRIEPRGQVGGSFHAKIDFWVDLSSNRLGSNSI